MNEIINKIKKKDKFFHIPIYKIDGNKYYVKRNQNYENIFCEFIIYELANKVEIDVVKPFYFTNGDKVTMITKDFKEDGYNSIKGEEILKDYLEYLIANKLIDDDIKEIGKEEVLSKMNNLSCIFNAIEYHLKIKYNKVDKEVLENLKKELVKRFSFDIITMQSDRGYRNWEILENDNIKDFKLAPLFDNEYSFSNFNGVSYMNSITSDIIKVNYNDKDNKTIKDILVEFLTTSSLEFVSLFINMFDKLDKNSLLDLIDNLKKNTGLSISLIYLNKLIEFYENNYNEIKDVLKALNLNKSEGDIHAR